MDCAATVRGGPSSALLGGHGGARKTRLRLHYSTTAAAAAAARCCCCCCCCCCCPTTLTMQMAALSTRERRISQTHILQELRAKIDQACRTAEEFTKLYYESLDKRRYLMSRLYMDTAILIWNGNGIEGKDQIQNFWTELPTSDHSVITLDAQPITGPAVASQLTFLVKVSGQVKYQDKAAKTFNQNFLITALGDKWKIVSDCFRTQEALES